MAEGTSVRRNSQHEDEEEMEHGGSPAPTPLRTGSTPSPPRASSSARESPELPQHNSGNETSSRHPQRPGLIFESNCNQTVSRMTPDGSPVPAIHQSSIQHPMHSELVDFERHWQLANRRVDWRRQFQEQALQQRLRLFQDLQSVVVLYQHHSNDPRMPLLDNLLHTNRFWNHWTPGFSHSQQRSQNRNQRPEQHMIEVPATVQVYDQQYQEQNEANEENGGN